MVQSLEKANNIDYIYHYESHEKEDESMGAYINYANRVEFLSHKWNNQSLQYTFTQLNQNICYQIINNPRIQYIQISEYIPDDRLEMINELFRQRPDFIFRIYGFHGNNSVCDLSFLNQLTAVKRLSIDYIRNVKSIETLKIMSLEHLRLYVYDLKDYTILKDINRQLKYLSIYYQAKGKACFDGIWLLRFENLQELYLGRISKNIKCISELKELKKLTLRGIKLSDLSFLKYSNINDLSIHWCSMNDLHTLSDNQNLKSLELWRILKLEDLSFISTLPHLETLRLIDLRNVEILPDMMHTQIKSLYLENLKNLIDISCLNHLKTLKKVEMIGIQKLELNQLQVIFQNQAIQNIEIKGAGSKKKANEIENLKIQYKK